MIPGMLMVVLGVLSLVLAFPVPVLRWDEIPWLGIKQTPTLVLSLVVVATLLPGVIAWLLQKPIIRKLEADPKHPGDAQHRYYWFSQFVQWGLGGLHAGLLVATNWQNYTRDLPVVGDWLIVPSLIASTPFLIAVVLVWIAFYPAERAIKQVTLEVQLMRGKPVRPVSEVVSHIINNLRHQVLFILIPMMMIILVRDLTLHNARALKRFSHGYDAFQDVVIGSAALLIALITPEILRHVWLTQRLPVGGLRDRLLILSQHIGVKCREILVWKAGEGIVNAAVMGVIAPLRYVLITESMIEQLKDRQIEAVYGHEAGHVKRWHILYLLLFAAISGSMLTIFSVRTRDGMSTEMYQFVGAILGAILFVKWYFVFAWISQRFERQADIYGVRTLMLTGLECHSSCRIHGDPVPKDLEITRPRQQTPQQQQTAPASDALPPEPSAQRKPLIELTPREILDKRAPLCKTAAEYYGATLTQVAHLNGIPAEAWSWRHGSIADRGRTVERFASDPKALEAFEQSVMRMKIGLTIFGLLALSWTAIELKVWALAGLILRTINTFIFHA